jgi:hypothetical protein
MLAHSPRDRSRSPHNSTETSSNPIESTGNSKTKKETETQQRLKNLKVIEQKTISTNFIDFYLRHLFKH